jgi:hypothetical protein
MNAECASAAARMLWETYGCYYLPNNPDWDEAPSHGLIKVASAVDRSGSVEDDGDLLLQHGLDRWAFTWLAVTCSKIVLSTCCFPCSSL